MNNITYCDPQGKTASTIELSDCGKTIRMYNPDGGYNHSTEVQMVIKTSRGTLVIYRDDTNHYHKASKAIKAFMKGQKNV